MTKAECHLTRLPGDILAFHLTGKWQLEQDVPSAETVQEQLHAPPPIKGVVFDTKALTAWDSSILAFLVEVMKVCSKAGIQLSKKGLPKGVQQLMDLATAVPKKEDARKSVTHDPFLSKIGSDTLRFVQSSGELISFIGEAFVAFTKLTAHLRLLNNLFGCCLYGLLPKSTIKFPHQQCGQRILGCVPGHRQDVRCKAPRSDD